MFGWLYNIMYNTGVTHAFVLNMYYTVNIKIRISLMHTLNVIQLHRRNNCNVKSICHRESEIHS